MCIRDRMYEQDRTRPRKYAHREGLEQQDALSDEEQAAFGETVGDHAAEEREDESGSEADGHHRPQHERRVRQLEHQPRLSHLLRPRAGEGGQLSEPEELIAVSYTHLT